MSQISRTLKVKKSSNNTAKDPEKKLQNVQNGKPPAITTKIAQKSKDSRRSRSADPGNLIVQTQITDFFQRRSSRKQEAQSKAEQQAAMERRIIEGKEDGLEIKVFADKGRGVVATRHFAKGEYVVEYYGELITVSEAKQREKTYAEDPSVGCYMLYFLFKGRKLCVDATSESGRLGRLVNHKRFGNCVTKAVTFAHDVISSDTKKTGRSSPSESPRVLLVATRDISPGEEILYDYGDRSPESIASHPWLAS